MKYIGFPPVIIYMLFAILPLKYSTLQAVFPGMTLPGIVEEYF